LERLDHTRRWLRAFGAFEIYSQNFVRSFPSNQELVKSQWAGFSVDARLHSIVCHRQHVRVHAQSFTHLLCNIRKFLSLIQHQRAVKYGCPVAIAYPQKLRLPKSFEHFVAEKCVTADAVPLVLIDDASQRVHNTIDIRGNVQA